MMTLDRMTPSQLLAESVASMLGTVLRPKDAEAEERSEKEIKADY